MPTTKSKWTWLLWLLSALMVVIGLTLSIGGAYLATLGGSLYFLLMGLALIVSAVLIFKGKPSGAWLYAVAFVLSIIWAVWDAGLAFWPLFSRLFTFGVLAFLTALAYPLLKTRAGLVARKGPSFSLAAVLAVALIAVFGNTFVPTPIISADNDQAPVKPVAPGANRKTGKAGVTPPPVTVSLHWIKSIKPTSTNFRSRGLPILAISHRATAPALKTRTHRSR